MATFVSTTLTNRTTGSTVFKPHGYIDGRSGLLTPDGAGFEGIVPSIKMAQTLNGSNGGRKTTASLTIPQVEVIAGSVFPVATTQPVRLDIVLYVPFRANANDVNNIVGWGQQVLTAGTTNFNALFVGGEGVW